MDSTKHNGMSVDNPPQGLDISLIIVFNSLALYNVVELLFIIASTFKRRSGLYFWMFVLATTSIVPHSAGFLLKNLSVDNRAIEVWITFVFVGWTGMVTGQSLVLWSRLHLVMQDRQRLRAVLWMIIFDAIICHIPIAILMYGSNSHTPGIFLSAYAIYERIQVTVFSVQETIISALYIYETAQLLRRESSQKTSNQNSNGFGQLARRKVMTHLIYISVIIILLDVPLLTLQYLDYYDLQTSYKPFVYSVKLKLEFSILNRLIEVTRPHPSTLNTNISADTGGVGGPGGERLSNIAPAKTTTTTTTTTTRGSGAPLNRGQSAASSLGSGNSRGSKTLTEAASEQRIGTPDFRISTYEIVQEPLRFDSDVDTRPRRMPVPRNELAVERAGSTQHRRGLSDDEDRRSYVAQVCLDESVDMAAMLREYPARANRELYGRWSRLEY